MSPTPPPDEPIRPHVFDGIQEYDKRLPNWWLYTLYVTIVFWIGYWAYYEWLHLGPSSTEVVDAAMGKIEAQRLAATKLDDAGLWQMSHNATFVDAGQAAFVSNCAACHLASGRGKSESPAAIGPDLMDTAWIHGGRPVQIHDVIMKGVPEKGMPTWGPVLGAKKVTEITAFLLSKHKEGEPITVEGAKP